MKKVVIFFLIMIACAGIFCGCSGKEPTTEPKENEKAKLENLTPVDAKKKQQK